MYGSFFLILVMACMVMPFAYLILGFPAHAICLIVAKRPEDGADGPLPLWSKLLIALAWVWQLLLVLLWAAFCATVTMRVASRPEISHAWFYYLTGAVFLLLPTLYMASKGANAPTGIAILAMSLAFGCFCLRPALMWPLHSVLSNVFNLESLRERRASVSNEIPPATIQLLKAYLPFEETVRLLSEKATTEELSRYVYAYGAEFVKQEQREQLTVEVYRARKSGVLGMQLTYISGQLIGVSYALEPESDGFADQLKKVALQVIRSDRDRQEYFLGWRRLSSSHVVKVILSEDNSQGIQTHFVLFGLSEERG